MRNAFLVSLMSMIVFSCKNSQNIKPSESEVEKMRADYDSLATNLIKSLDYIKKPLSELTKEQQLLYDIRYYDPRFKRSSGFFYDILTGLKSLKVLGKGSLLVLSRGHTDNA